mmetsp:Transcript_30692/g.76891  ORF Transcript_30692/g.76891 Transcript_30692/m.76891 type:complete len:200 (+) Transcript_30692:463-1062(+)
MPVDITTATVGEWMLGFQTTSHARGSSARGFGSHATASAVVAVAMAAETGVRAQETNKATRLPLAPPPPLSPPRLMVRLRLSLPPGVARRGRWRVELTRKRAPDLASSGNASGGEVVIEEGQEKEEEEEKEGGELAAVAAAARAAVRSAGPHSTTSATLPLSSKCAWPCAGAGEGPERLSSSPGPRELTNTLWYSIVVR